MTRTIAPLQIRPQDDDAALLERARAGDAHARDALIGRYLDDVYALTTRMLGDADLGADAAQNAFINALRGLDGFRGDSSFRTWLLRIAANAARSIMRTRSRRRETTLELVSERADPAADAAAAQALQRDEAERAIALLAQLPTKQRQVVALRLEGFDYREIGRLAGCSEGAARVNYHHAMKRLRELMR